jgi:signal peptidase
MEIRTSPHRPTPTPWGRLMVFVVVLGPVSVLVLLPIGLGLQRYVMTGDSMQGSIDRGSVLLERVVPVSDLRVGDVITYRAPASAEHQGLVTHRIVAIGPEGISTRGDASSSPDPWTLPTPQSTVPRVTFILPWVGYAYLLLLEPHTWVLVLASLGALGVLLPSERLRRGRATRSERRLTELVGASGVAAATMLRGNGAD